MKKIDWAKRIQRAGDLAERYPSAAEILGFYRHILEFQKTLRTDSSSPAIRSADIHLPFRARLKLDTATRQLPALLSLVQRKGPSKLALEAEKIGRAPSEDHRQMLGSFLLSANGDEQELNPFFAQVLFQPYAEHLAATAMAQPEGFSGSICPICSARPQVAILRPEGDGGKRFLVCSFCSTEWEFRRILCPVCGEEDNAKLPRFTAEGISAVRVEACDTCSFYLKSVDMTVDGLAVPLVDEVATAPLDVWAVKHGFNKISLNLMGF
jgi:FdhE protein